MTLDIPNAQIATFIPDWNKVNQALISGKMDKEEYDMWLEDTLKLFNVPIDLTKTQQYLEWFKNKLYLNAIATSAKNRIVYRGQVYRCNLGVGIGSEECKERPCVVLQYNSANRTSPNTLVAPITHTTSTLPIVVPIAEKKDSSGKLILDGNVLLGNITCVSKARLSDYITDLSADEMKAVDKAISLSLGINHHYQTLQNMYDDKLQYIEKLKSNRTLLQTDLDSKQRQLDKFQELLDTYQFSDIQNLADFLEKSQKEM
uniref:mRNA interferase MazF n=1 Tax=Eubacterium plexicaudatum ASF492 TaxID=1235802 RepID=N1ZQX8_9FIRM